MNVSASGLGSSDTLRTSSVDSVLLEYSGDFHLSANFLKDNFEVSQSINLRVQGELLIDENIDLLANFDGYLSLQSEQEVHLTPNSLLRLREGKVDLWLKAPRIIIDGEINLGSELSDGGNLILEGDVIQINDNAKIITSGFGSGGDILIGGSWQGGLDINNSFSSLRKFEKAATSIALAPNATLNASAICEGNGGTIVLWSDIENPNSSTIVKGYIVSNGVGKDGIGGNVETSGFSIDIDGISVNTLGHDNSAGTWLIDPYSYFLDSSELASLSANLESTNISLTTTSSNASGVNSAFTSSHSGGAQIASGNIVFQNDFIYNGSSNRILTLTADNDIYLESVTSSSGVLSLNLNAAGDIIYLNGDIDLKGGNFTTTASAINFQGIGNQVLNTSGGNVDHSSRGLHRCCYKRYLFEHERWRDLN